VEHSFIDQYSNLESFIHRLDPRVKIIVFFGFVLIVALTNPLAYYSFLFYGLVLLGLIFLSRIPLLFILKRYLIITPFVLLVAATCGSLTIFWNVFIKSLLAAVCLILLSSTTKFSSLLKAFEKLRVPKMFTMIFSFMYRYIFILVDELMRLKRAKDSRTVGGSRWFHAKALANMIGVLFIQAYNRAERVYLAMCSRGFDGEIKTLDRFQLRVKDIIFVFVMAVLLSSIRLIGR
jgi:cobalt/nickel transport system permease protein